MAQRMSIRRYQDLGVWQAADALRQEVYTLTGSGLSARDFRFNEQLRSAAGSVAANIVEGYRRYSPKDFARFLDIAYASAGEVANWLDDGVARGYWSREDLIVARRQIRRVDAGLKSMMRYLRTDRAKANADFARRARSHEPEG